MFIFKKMKKYFIGSLMFVLVSLVVSDVRFVSLAGECDVVTETYRSNVKNTDLNITRTMLDVFTGGVFIPIPIVYSVGANDLLNCMGYVEGEIGSLVNRVGTMTGTEAGGAGASVCNTTDTDICASLVSNHDDSGISASGGGDKAIAGSLLGLSNSLEGFVYNEPIPVNLAYFWNQSISKIPFVNKALAADTDPAENMPMIKVALSAWQFTRNIALALMSVVLLYTGIMIIMRKKVNQQLVVSVQYAIPKILVGLVLILFSYAIGAVIASIGWGLFRGGSQIVYGYFFETDTVSNSLVLLYIVEALMSEALGAIFALILSILVGVFLIVMKIVLYFKAFFIYIKMIIAIITAPLEMALGTVPGSDARITDWFVRMAKYCVTLLAMGVIIPITMVLALVVVQALQSGSGSEVGGWGIMMGLLAPMAIVISGFSLGIGMESKIDTLFSGTSKKK